MHFEDPVGVSPYVVVAVLADIVQILLGLVSLAPNTTYTQELGGHTLCLPPARMH
jgi:hypothetical protein